MGHLIINEPEYAAMSEPVAIPRYQPMIGCVRVPDQWIAELGHETMTAASAHAHSGMCHWGDRAAVVDLETGDVTVVCGSVNERETAGLIESARLAAQVQAAFA
jgi:hypothetical protein